KDDATADRLLREFQVDILFPVKETDPIKQFIGRYPHLRNPLLSAREIFREDWYSKKNKIAYLDVLNAIDRYWEREFKHAPPERESNCRLLTWDDTDRLKEVFALSFGAYPTNLNLKRDFHQGFLKGLKAKETGIDLNGRLDARIVGTVTPIRLTGIDLQG